MTTQELIDKGIIKKHTPISEQCEECSGEGELSLSYEEEITCETCEGSGLK